MPAPDPENVKGVVIMIFEVNRYIFVLSRAVPASMKACVIGLLGVTDAEAAEADPGPLLFVAVTLKV